MNRFFRSCNKCFERQLIIAFIHSLHCIAVRGLVEAWLLFEDNVCSQIYPRLTPHCPGMQRKQDNGHYQSYFEHKKIISHQWNKPEASHQKLTSSAALSDTHWKTNLDEGQYLLVKAASYFQFPSVALLECLDTSWPEQLVSVIMLAGQRGCSGASN